MAETRVIRDVGAPVFIGGDYLHGVQNTNVPGPVSPRVPVRNTLARVQQFVEDIPDPGVAAIVLSFNPAIPIHGKLRGWQENRTTLLFEWIIEGSPVNGVNTKTGTTVGTMTASGVTAAGKLTFSSGVRPKVGDYLVPGSGETLIVTSIDYGVTPFKYVVTKSDGTAPTAVNANKDYTIKAPAQMLSWQGKILGLPTQGGLVVTRTLNVNIDGEVTETVGSPDIA